MAKTPKTPPRRLTGPGKWQPEPSDAVNLATLRWYALTIDRLLLQIYCTDRSKQAAMQAILDKALHDLYRHAKDIKFAEDQCPDGQRLCDDGLCAPTCLFDNP